MFRALCCLLSLGFSLLAGEPRMSWLDNGTLRLGVNLDLGGAITWLSRSGSETNVINSKDRGRQVQMSFYGGPMPFIVGDKRPKEFWKGLGWNPIQAGDYFRHGSPVLEVRNDGRALYVKCIPMQWPLDDVPGECAFESWLELDGPSVRARGRLLNARADHTQYPARTQELPAVYANGPYYRLLSYTGDRPFSGAPLTQVEAKGRPRGRSGWRRRGGARCWMTTTSVWASGLPVAWRAKEALQASRASAVRPTIPAGTSPRSARRSSTTILFTISSIG